MPTEPNGTVVVVDEVVVVVGLGATVVVVVVVVVGGTVVVVVVVVVVLVVVGAAVVVVVLSMETLAASELLAGPVLPALSVTPFAAIRSMTVPSLVQVTETVIELPEAADGVNAQPAAEPPELLKSPEAMPETVSPKVIE